MKTTIEHKAEIIKKLINRVKNHLFENEYDYCKNAIREMISDLYCDTKFDPFILQDILIEDGWTKEDFKYFGIDDLFNEEE